MQEQNEWQSEENVLDVDIQLTDDVVSGSANKVAFKPLFKHMLLDQGAIKFALFKGCPCALFIKLAVSQEGIGRAIKTTTCDLCSSTNENNNERIGAVLEGFNTCMDEALSSEVGQLIVKDSVKKHTGADMEEFVVASRRQALEQGLTPSSLSEDTERIITDAQVLMAMVEHLLALIDMSTLDPKDSKGLLSLVELLGKIKANPAFEQPTPLVQKAMDHAKESIEKEADDDGGSLWDQEKNNIRDIVDKIESDMKKKDEDTSK